MMVAATAGYMYSMNTGKGWFSGTTGGAIAGGLGGFAGFGLSVLLGEVATGYLPIGTSVCVLTGALGGPFGQMAYNLREIASNNRKR